jgi:hypothetical protein
MLNPPPCSPTFANTPLPDPLHQKISKPVGWTRTRQFTTATQDSPPPPISPGAAPPSKSAWSCTAVEEHSGLATRRPPSSSSDWICPPPRDTERCAARHKMTAAAIQQDRWWGRHRTTGSATQHDGRRGVRLADGRRRPVISCDPVDTGNTIR